jgi:hypothetical protein
MTGGLPHISSLTYMYVMYVTVYMRDWLMSGLGFCPCAGYEALQELHWRW